MIEPLEGKIPGKNKQTKKKQNKPNQKNKHLMESDSELIKLIIVWSFEFYQTLTLQMCQLTSHLKLKILQSMLGVEMFFLDLRCFEEKKNEIKSRFSSGLVLVQV